MRKQRFTNGVKKVLKRQYPNESEVEEIFNNGSLWERGTGVKSLKPKGNDCLADGDNSFAKGINSNSYMRNIDSYSIPNKLIPDVKLIQKNSINLHLAIKKDGDYYFSDDLGHDLIMPVKTWWKGRFMALVVNMANDTMTSWSGIFSAGNRSGTIVLRQNTTTKEGDENDSDYTLNVEVNEDRLRFRLTSKKSDKGYGIINIDWVELKKS